MNYQSKVIEINGILMQGGSCIISANDFENIHLTGMINIAKSNNASLLIKNAENLDPIIAGSINLNGNKNVTLDFT